ncbi:MAG: methyltransferase domain-containing protein [Dehalococcoidia bacterium]
MHESLVEILQCPACRGDLCWAIEERDGGVLLEADASCEDCGALYQVREGIGTFLTPDLQRTDLWEEEHSELTDRLSKRPDLRAKLLDGPLDELEPVDRLLRAQYLSERGDVAGAEEAGRGVQEQLYTPELNELWDECLAHIAQISSGHPGPIVDVASGRGTLVELMAEAGSAHIVATDFSVRVLRRSRRRLLYTGQAGRVSHLVVDARKTPFCDEAIPALSSHMGLANIIEGASDALSELRRVCGGVLIFSHAFCRPDDPVHAPILRQIGHPLAFLDDAMEALDSAGWNAEVLIKRRVPVKPTPKSKLIPEMVVDRFPLAEAEFDGVLVAAC